jgi:hypothetical protein
MRQIKMGDDDVMVNLNMARGKAGVDNSVGGKWQ